MAQYRFGIGTVVKPSRISTIYPNLVPLEAEAGVFCSTFDMTGTRLITGCADKTIKVRVSLKVLSWIDK